jgi:RNA polymerase sigma-70 factor, ECF subfamily
VTYDSSPNRHREGSARYLGISDGETMTDNWNRNGDGLLSDEPTVELITRARTGDSVAAEALMQRCLPALKRWAHGKLPPMARSYMDTGDLVQEAALNAIRHLDTFEARRVGAMQAYLVQSVINRIRDEVRRVTRRGVTSELPDDAPSDDHSPLELAIAAQAYDRYRDALKRLKSRDRQIAVARIELQWTAEEVAERFHFRTRDGARMATTRALERLAAELNLTPDSPDA